MTDLHERLYLQCPYHRARNYLERALREASTTGEAQEIRLRLPMSARTPEHSLEKGVLVTYASAEDPMHMDQPWRIHWTPSGGGPYPDFDGTLAVRGDYDYTTCALELQGEYKPPMGLAGEAFDMLVGSRIAATTAREFLREIGTRMETQYRAEEAAKAN